jgi:hypothetical protein
MSIKIGTCWYARITCRWASVALARAVREQRHAATTIAEPRASLDGDDGSHLFRTSYLCVQRVRGVLQCLDVNFLHLHHCTHDPLRGVFRHQLSEASVVDLPGQAKPVLEPATDIVRATRAQGVPESVDIRLFRAIDEEGEGFTELVVGTAIRADIRRPCSSKATTIAEPFGPGPASPQRETWVMRESSNSET